MVRGRRVRCWLPCVLGLWLSTSTVSKAAPDDPLATSRVGRILVEQVDAIQPGRGIQFTGAIHWQPEFGIGRRLRVAPRIGVAPMRSAGDRTFLAADASILVIWQLREPGIAWFAGPAYSAWVNRWVAPNVGIQVGGRYVLGRPWFGVVRRIQVTESVVSFRDAPVFVTFIGFGADF